MPAHVFRARFASIGLPGSNDEIASGNYIASLVDGLMLVENFSWDARVL
jgi:hypothetical protein